MRDREKEKRRKSEREGERTMETGGEREREMCVYMFLYVSDVYDSNMGIEIDR